MFWISDFMVSADLAQSNWVIGFHCLMLSNKTMQRKHYLEIIIGNHGLPAGRERTLQSPENLAPADGRTWRMANAAKSGQGATNCHPFEKPAEVGPGRMPEWNQAAAGTVIFDLFMSTVKRPFCRWPVG